MIELTALETLLPLLRLKIFVEGGGGRVVENGGIELLAVLRVERTSC